MLPAREMHVIGEAMRYELRQAVIALEIEAVTTVGASERKKLGAIAVVHARRAERLGESTLADRALAVASCCLR